MEIASKVEEEVSEESLTGLTKDMEMVKLFVGQVPRSWEDPELREVMEKYGPIQELTILKDRTDGTSKGKSTAKFFKPYSLLASWLAI